MFLCAIRLESSRLILKFFRIDNIFLGELDFEGSGSEENCLDNDDEDCPIFSGKYKYFCHVLGVLKSFLSDFDLRGFACYAQSIDFKGLSSK